MSLTNRDLWIDPADTERESIQRFGHILLGAILFVVLSFLVWSYFANLDQITRGEGIPDFADWPLGERAVADALQAWSTGGRSLKMLAHRFDVFERHHARFVHWRRLWDHIVQCRALPQLNAGDVPSAIWTPSWSLLRIDPERSRGVCGASAADRVALRHRIDEGFQLGRPAFAASVLGL